MNAENNILLKNKNHNLLDFSYLSILFYFERKRWYYKSLQ
jgi:hypothetical protein